MRIKRVLNRNAVLILTLVFTAYFLVIASGLNTQWAQDSHWHMALVKNLASGNGYTLEGIQPHSKYPPGLSLLILPFFLIFQNVHLSGLIVVGILSLLSIVLTYKIGSLIDRKTGIVASVFLVFHNLFVFSSVSVLTEIPFMFFTLVSIYLFQKSFEKPICFTISLFCSAIAFLIRYEAFLLLPVFVFVFYEKYKENRNSLEFLQSKEFVLGCFFGILIVGAWLFRNFIVFGSPFYSAYSNEIGLASSAFVFLKMFFKLGYILPFLAILGIFSVIRERNKIMIPYLIWFFLYVFLHLFWQPILRFYVEVLALICIFASIGMFYVLRLVKREENKEKYLMAGVLLVIFIQIFIFFNGVSLGMAGETTIRTLNRYDSIRLVSEWANVNLPKDAVYAVPDVAVYSHYLDKPKIVYYDGGLSYAYQNNSNVYLFADTLHSWITKEFLAGESGEIVLFTGNARINIKTELESKQSYKNKSEAIVMLVKDIESNSY